MTKSNRFIPKGGFRKLNILVDSAIQPSFKQNGFITQKIITNWPDIIGSKLAKITSPRKIYFDKQKNGSLLLEVFNPGFALEIQASSTMIIERINTFFGYEAINQIKTKIIKKQKTKKTNTSPVSKTLITQEQHKNIEEEINRTTDNELKELLTSIMKKTFKTI